ncbi:MAG: tripartite tricarboxylate transporter permease, partial [Brevibacterium sp.]|nr:tripartite tricarboxylate transporter permease [Brevibacterium sp.]MDN5909139.1 tripartite tricarboxylate transporter permease [Brevibacterium sp.]
ASQFELMILLGIGIISFVLKRYGVPLAPLMIGMVLGPLAESSLRDALLASGNDVSVLVSSPITIVLYALLIAALLYTGIGRVLARKRQKTTAPKPDSESVG